MEAGLLVVGRAGRGTHEARLGQLLPRVRCAPGGAWLSCGVMDRLTKSQGLLKGLLRLRAVLPEKAFREARGRLVPRVRCDRGLRDRDLIRRADFVIVSHPKSGRTWLRTLLSRLFQERYGLPAEQILEFDNFHAQDARVPVIFFTDDNYVNDVSSDPASKIDYRDKRVVLLVREPLDIAVSIYHQHARRTQPHKRALNGIPDNVAQLAMFDYIREHPQGLRHVVEFLNGWERNRADFEQLLMVRYEDLHAHTAQTLGRITAFLGLDFSLEELQRSAEFASADNLRKLASQDFFKNHRLSPTDAKDPNSHKVRRAKVRGYREDFTPDELESLESYVRENLEPSLGYSGGEAATESVARAADS